MTCTNESWSEYMISYACIPYACISISRMYHMQVVIIVYWYLFSNHYTHELVSAFTQVKKECISISRCAGFRV